MGHFNVQTDFLSVPGCVLKKFCRTSRILVFAVEADFKSSFISEKRVACGCYCPDFKSNKGFKVNIKC